VLNQSLKNTMETTTKTQESLPESRKRPRPNEERILGSEELPFSISWPSKGNAIVTFSKCTPSASSASEPTRLCLLGRAQLRCSKGAVNVLGYRLDSKMDQMMEVEAPPWSSLLVLEPAFVDDTNEDVELEVKNWHPHSEILGCENTFELSKYPFPGVRPTLIPPTWEHVMDNLLPEVRTAVSAKSATKASLETRDSAMEELQFRMVICGAKGVGKSTFLRYALNRILSDAAASKLPTQEQLPSPPQRVAIIDADVGQPEMSPPGLLTLTVVSDPLLTPPHHRALANLPHHEQVSYYFGSVTSKNDPHRYMELIQQLVRDYEREYLPLGIPLMVNLDGWVKGLGYELLSTLLTEIIAPTQVVQIVGLTKSKQFELGGVLNSERANLHIIYSYNSTLNIPSTSSGVSTSNGGSTDTTTATMIDPFDIGGRKAGEASFLSAMNMKVPLTCTMPAPALRALRLSTYFLNDVSIWHFLGFGHEGIADDTCEIAHRLAGSLPYAVPFEAVDIEWEGSDHFADIASDSSPANFNLRLDAINAKLVGLCCRPEQSTRTEQAQNSNDEAPLRCVGLGLVRSIDRIRKTFYILTPVDGERLKDVNVLVGGTVDVPVEFWFRGAYAESFPYQSYSTTNNSIGTEPMKSRNTIGRKSHGT